jgi:hypothetical protein
MCFKKEIDLKNGILYSIVKPQLRPFDPIFFKGGELVSNSIRTLQQMGNKIPHSGDFTHVGIVVTSEILDDVHVLPGKTYIWESILGGVLGHGITNIQGKTFIGVQLRDFDQLIINYDQPNSTRIACGHLLRNPLDYEPHDQIKQRFTDFFRKYDGAIYDFNFYSLLSSLFRCLRPCREPIEEICRTEKWIFCSELVALAYKHFGVYPSTINEKNVVPRDIAFPEADHDLMPKVIGELTYIITPLHAEASPS